jgi:hypothetical protein
VRSPLLVDLGLLDGGKLRRTAEQVRPGGAQRFGALLSCLGFEHWLRAVTGERAPAARGLTEWPKGARIRYNQHHVR